MLQLILSGRISTESGNFCHVNILLRYGLCKRTAQRYKLAAGFFDDPGALGSGSGRRRTGPRSAAASFDADDGDQRPEASFSTIRNNLASPPNGDFPSSDLTFGVPIEMRPSGPRAVSLPATVLENGVGCGKRRDPEWRATDGGEGAEGVKCRTQEVYL